jgi:hydroxymethylbilane synthase
MLAIGSRGSALALTQATWVKEQILRFFPQARINIKIISTSADRDTKTSIRSAWATGVFVKEIEDALLAREIDLAVHSMKDLPTRIPEALEIAAIPVREDPRDALIAPKQVLSLNDLPNGAIVGTGSIRRQAQLLALRPDLRMRDIRGNVDTRLRKMEDGMYDAVILACAGLRRLGLENRITLPLELDTMIPAPGQGALALETRRGDSRAGEMIQAFHHPPTAAAVLAERAFLRSMGGGCNSPIAVHAHLDENSMKIVGLVAQPDGKRVLRQTWCQVDASPEATGESLANALMSMGARDILSGARPS